MISMAVKFLMYPMRESLLVFVLYETVKVDGNDIIRMESNNTLPEEGNSIRLSCLVQDSTDNPITWFYNNKRAGMCYRGGPYCSGVLSGLSITADEYGSYMEIIRLQRTSHEGNYSCTFATSATQLYSGNINIIVYAIPQGLMYSQQPTTDTDLIASSVTLQCQTDGCTYPAVQIRWYFKDQNNTYRVYNTTSRTEEQESCQLPEKIYSSQLNISRYTTWSDNSDKSVAFACGVEYLSSSRKIYSPQSKTVHFAVRVAEVTLITSESRTVVFYEGFTQSLTCISSPSRPVPTIRWWLGNRELIDNITNLDTTDTNLLHVQTSSISLALARDSRNQKIFCEGFIIGQKIPATSIQLTVDVWYAPDVNVTSANLTQENMSSSVRCEVKGVPAQYTFHPWKHLWGDVVIRSDLQGTQTNSTSSSHNTLILERLSLQDMGAYICSADNGIKGINGDIVQTGALELKVTGILSIINEDNSLFYGEVGQSINIVIPFYSDPAIQEFVFQKNGTAITNTSRISMKLSTAMVDYHFYSKLVKLEVLEAHLSIWNLTLHDFENYTLVLKNSMKTKEFKVQLYAAVNKIQEQASPKVAEIAGGIVAAVVVVAVVTGVFIFIKRRNKSSDELAQHQNQSLPLAGPEYINTAFRSDISTTEYEALQQPKKETSPYESLNVPTSELIFSTDIRPSSGETFCNIITPFEDNQGNTYRSQSSKDGNKIHENNVEVIVN